jgi:hypothetical protein
MAINNKTPMNEGLQAKIDDFYAPNTVAFLIDDSGGNLNNTSTMTQVAAQELPAGNGYGRIQVNIPFSAIQGTNPVQAVSTSDDIVFQASGGNIPLFTHICFVINGNTTVGNTTGKIDRIEPVNNGTPISLNDGESYKHSFVHKEQVTYANS